MMARTSTELVDYGCEWVSEHEQAFKTLMHLVHLEIEAGNPRVQRGDVYILARERGIDVSDVDGFRRDNSLWAVLTRYMVMLRPKLARALHFRDAAIDRVDMEARWREIVNPETVFLATSWKSAKEAVLDGDCTAQVHRGGGGGR